MKGILENDQMKGDSANAIPTNVMEASKGNRKRVTSTIFEGYITNK
jgi:hypothetical protein